MKQKLNKKIKMDLQKIQKSVHHYGCYHINIKGIPKISRVGHYIYDMSLEEEALRTEQANFFKSFCGGGFLDLLSENKEVRQLLGIPQQWIDLAYENNPNKMPMAVYIGFDLCGEKFVINDLNSDRAIVAGYQPEIAMSFAEEEPTKNFRSFYDGLQKVFQYYTGKSNPRVLILKDINDPHIIAFESFSKRMGFSIASINDFSAYGIDVVLRTIRTHDTILQEPEKYKKLTDALKKGLPMINPTGAALAGHKGWIPFLTHKGLVNRFWFPESFLVFRDHVTCSDGTFEDRQWINSVLLSNRNSFVVKNVFSAGGREVFRGKDFSLASWTEFWKKAEEKEYPILVEKIQDKFLKDIFVIDEGNEISLKNLNLLQRVYTIHGSNEIYSEMFGCDSWKVNASGYAFPVSFEKKSI